MANPEHQDILEEEKAYDELLEYFKNQKSYSEGSQIDCLQLLLQCSMNESFILYINNYIRKDLETTWVLRQLLRNIGHKNTAISANAVEILINLTANDSIAQMLLDCHKDTISILLESIKEQHLQEQDILNKDKPQHIGVTLMLLSNITRHRNAIECLFDINSPVPDFKMMRFFLLLLEGPTNPNDVFWKDRGIFLLQILQNITSLPEAVEFLLERRMKTINSIIQMLPRLPSFCQISFLTFLLRICIQTRFHSKILPNSKNNDTEINDCELLPALCCFLYPAKDSDLRADALQGIEAIPQDTTRKETEIQRLRYIHPSVSEKSYGVAGDENSRLLIIECFVSLLASTEGRESLKDFGVYEVLRAYHHVESIDRLKERVEDIIHMLVYTEEELQDQDNSSQALSCRV